MFPRTRMILFLWRRLLEFARVEALSPPTHQSMCFCVPLIMCRKLILFLIDSLAQSSVALVPDFDDAANNSPMTLLKSHVENLKPLGFVRVDLNELLVIYDGMRWTLFWKCVWIDVKLQF